MKLKIVILIALCSLLSNCQSVFVWTVQDVIGLGFLGLIIIIGLFIGLLILLDKFKMWWKNNFK
jgi:hypothetical protein